MRDYRRDELLGTVFDFALLPAFGVSGRVVDADGEPVAGAYVAAVASEWDSIAEKQRTDWRSSRSAADGSFAVEDLRPDVAHALFVKKDGYGTVVYEFGHDEGHVALGDVELRAGALLRGEVVDESGEPIAGQLVELHGSNADRGRLGMPRQAGLDMYVAEREARTDDLGRFAFADLAAGDYELKARYGGSSAPVRALAIPDGGEVSGVRIELGRGLSITGRVTDPEGRGVVGVFWSVSGEGGPASGRTGADGVFEVTGLVPAAYDIQFFPIGESESTGESRRLASVDREAVVAGTRDLVVALPWAGSVVGRVVDADGAPVRYATVRATDAAGSTYWGLSDADGDFTVQVPEGEQVDLVAMPPLLAEDGEPMPYQFDTDPAVAVSLAGVLAGGEPVRLELPRRP